MRKTLLIIFLILLLTACQQKEKQPESEQKPIVVEKITPKKEYTVEEPGNWKDVAKEHDLTIEILRDQTKDNIVVYVPINSHSRSHYIEKVGIIDSKGRDLVSKSLSSKEPRKMVKVFLTLYPLPSEANIKVYAKCSKHDLWTKPLHQAVYK